MPRTQCSYLKCYVFVHVRIVVVCRNVRTCGCLLRYVKCLDMRMLQCDMFGDMDRAWGRLNHLSLSSNNVLCIGSKDK